MNHLKQAFKMFILKILKRPWFKNLVKYIGTILTQKCKKKTIKKTTKILFGMQIKITYTHKHEHKNGINRDKIQILSYINAAIILLLDPARQWFGFSVEIHQTLCRTNPGVHLEVPPRESRASPGRCPSSHQSQTFRWH